MVAMSLSISLFAKKGNSSCDCLTAFTLGVLGHN